jgi:hypothetical protein
LWLRLDDVSSNNPKGQAAMRLFRKARDDQPVDMNERSPQLGLRYKDLAILNQLMQAGADLTQPRHVIYYSYASSDRVARVMSQEAESRGFSAAVREPRPESPGQWALVCETHAVTSPDFVREADDFFEDLAQRHDAEYDGWEAGL